MEAGQCGDAEPHFEELPPKTSIPLEKHTVARRKFPRNSACPCGSGKKYKNCCYGNDFDWMVDDEGSVSLTFPISDERGEVLEEARQDFILKMGREPGPDDLVFPDMPPLVSGFPLDFSNQPRTIPSLRLSLAGYGTLTQNVRRHISCG